MIILVLGGARSGKSEVAETIAGRHERPVTYVATADAAGDADLAARIQAHRARRPAWPTVEVPMAGDLAATLAAIRGTALVDSLGTWLAGLPEFRCDHAALQATLRGTDAVVVMVSDEVGLGVHPSSDAGRRFRDALGTLNRAVAEVADEVLLVIAGRVLPLSRP